MTTASTNPTTSESANPSSVARSVGSVFDQRSPRFSQLTESTRLGGGSTSSPMPLRFAYSCQIATSTATIASGGSTASMRARISSCAACTRS